MGSTLEAQKKKAPKPKKRIVVTPDKPYYSSKSLEKGFKERLPSAGMAHYYRKNGSTARGALMGAMGELTDVLSFRDEEGKRGSRLAKKAAPLMMDRFDEVGGMQAPSYEEALKRNDGGMARKTRVF